MACGVAVAERALIHVHVHLTLQSFAGGALSVTAKSTSPHRCSKTSHRSEHASKPGYFASQRSHPREFHLAAPQQRATCCPRARVSLLGREDVGVMGNLQSFIMCGPVRKPYRQKNALFELPDTDSYVVPCEYIRFDLALTSLASRLDVLIVGLGLHALLFPAQICRGSPRKNSSLSRSGRSEQSTLGST